VKKSVSTENATNVLYPINIAKKRSDFDAFALLQRAVSAHRAGNAK
jgi:hypothetical protein